MSLQQIFINIKLHDLVVLLPWQLNNELYLHLKNNLKNKVEKKCIDAGYICKVNEIENYDNGFILPEDLSGNITFKVTYTANVCVPIPNNLMICKVDQIIKNVILCKNGPVNIIITFTNINVNAFNIDNQKNIIDIRTKKKIEIDDYLKIIIKSKRSYNGDNTIGVIGFIEDLATKEEIDEFMYKENDYESELETDNKTHYELNEDEFVSEGIEPSNKNLNNVLDI